MLSALIDADPTRLQFLRSILLLIITLSVLFRSNTSLKNGMLGFDLELSDKQNAELIRAEQLC